MLSLPKSAIKGDLQGKISVMTLPGGASDKFGNRYEGRWTVNCMIDMMDERADAIRLEPPGAEGEGIEFWVRRGDRREYHRETAAQCQWKMDASRLRT